MPVRQTLRHALGALAVCAGLALSMPASAVLQVSNLGNSPGNFNVSQQNFNADDLIAYSFKTGPDTYVLNGATLVMINPGTATSETTYEASIWSDDGTASMLPSATRLLTFDNQPSLPGDTTSATNVDFTSSAGFLLSPDTTYWLVVGGAPSNTGEFLTWRASDTNTFTSPSGWAIPFTSYRFTTDGGTNWQTAGPNPDATLFAIDATEVTQVPEPEHVFLFGLAALGATLRLRRRARAGARAAA